MGSICPACFINYYCVGGVVMSWTYWRGAQLNRKISQLSSDALMDLGNAVKAEANQQVPHDEGTLEESGTVMKNPSNKLEVKIGYGGGGLSGYPIVPYAIKWHEEPANFQKGRKHNYLLDPFNMIVPSQYRRKFERHFKKL